MSFNLTLKKAKSSDLTETEVSQLVEINNQNVRKKSDHAADLKGVCERFDPVDVFWVLLLDNDSDNNIAGAISIIPEIDPKHCIIVAMFVHKKYRKNGFARLLIQKCHEHNVKEYKINKVCGFVAKEDKKFLSFWKHLGAGTQEHLLTPAPSKQMDSFPNQKYKRKPNEIYFIHEINIEMKYEMPKSVKNLVE